MFLKIKNSFYDKKKKYEKILNKINNLEYKISKLSNRKLKFKTIEFKNLLFNGINLNKILPEVFAVCRESSKRILNMRHFDVQILSGIALHYGNIIEIGTGEGKTLIATLPAYLNSLTNKGVHIITLNEYLAKRDENWMKKLYNGLNLTTEVNKNINNDLKKKKAYNCDITYGTNNEFCFDYLRDNMILSIKDKVQRKLNYAIIDEVDCVLIDEARIPLIISELIKKKYNIYYIFNKIAKILIKLNINKKIYIVDKKKYKIYLTQNGYKIIEKLLVFLKILNSYKSLYFPKNIYNIFYINSALIANILLKKDKDYIIKNKKIIIIDEFTGRRMVDRRWSEGLHQALEAKEKLKINFENQHSASITFQNFFRIYNKISGMTGTAKSVKYEFKKNYNLETILIPPNSLNIRIVLKDKIFKNIKNKYLSVINNIIKCYNNFQPVLVGTTSIKNSEYISFLLKNINLPHNILNAKNYHFEAKIISKAGYPKMITISTNMAGRGTDIILGGNIKKKIRNIKKNIGISLYLKKKYIYKIYNIWKILYYKVIKSGGLYVIGTERHESRRIDNQLMGRCARQGNPGKCCFYLSLEDELFIKFSNNYIYSIINILDIKYNKVIESNILNNTIKIIQKKIELYNFNTRRELLKYDNILNKQRVIIYKQRTFFLKSINIYNIILSISNNLFTNFIKKNILYKSKKIIKKNIKKYWNINLIFNKTKINNILNIILYNINLNYKIYKNFLSEKKFNNFIRNIIIYYIDINWKKHIINLEDLKETIFFRNYGKKNPRQEYIIESYKLFFKMLKIIKKNIIKKILKKIFLKFKILSFIIL